MHVWELNKCSLKVTIMNCDMENQKPLSRSVAQGVEYFRRNPCEKRLKEVGLLIPYHGEKKVKENLIAIFKHLKGYCSCVLKIDPFIHFIPGLKKIMKHQSSQTAV